MKLSIVTTLYKSADSIAEFYRRSLAAAEPLGYEIEMIMVNDGSPDDSLQLAIGLHAADARVTVVDLSRNFGHHPAMMVGLSYATGDLVFLIDSDLDEDPELLQPFHNRLLQGDCDVVYGFQEKRRGGLFEKITGEIYYWLVKSLSDDPVPRNNITARLMTKDYVRALVRHRDRAFIIEQLWASAGFHQVGVAVKKHSRSPTTYSVQMRIEYLVKHLATSSTKALYYVFYLGLIISGIAGAMIAYYLYRYTVFGITVDGFTSIIVSIWFFGGLVTLILGVQGIYIASVLSESKRRPYAVIRKLYRAQSKQIPAGEISHQLQNSGE